MDRDFAFVVPHSHLSIQIEKERNKRTISQLRQCKCDLSKSFLPPVGQQLTFLTGKSTTGRRKGGSHSKHIMVPLDLLDERQQRQYSRNPGVKCFWDGEPFAGLPVGLPISQKNIRQKLAQPRKHKSKMVSRISKHQKFRTSKPIAVRQQRTRIFQQPFKLIGHPEEKKEFLPEPWITEPWRRCKQRNLRVPWIQTHEIVRGYQMYVRVYFR